MTRLLSVAHRTCQLPSSARVAGHAVPFLFGSLLAAAGLLKGYGIVTDGFSGGGVRLALADLEILFGAWLVLGLYPRLTRLLSLGLFTALFLVSLRQALSGEASCGCFGKLPVRPLYTLVLDAAAVLAFWFW